MATIFKRGNKWFAQWYRPDGSRVKFTTGLEKRREAQRKAEEMEALDRKEQLSSSALATEYERMLTRAAEDAQRGALTASRAEEYILAIRRAADPDFKVMTLHDCLKSWVADQQKRVGPSTAGGYRDMLAAAVKVLGNEIERPLPDFTHQDASKLLHGLKKGRTAATANLHFRAFRRALQWAVRAKQISDNPATGVKPLPETDSSERAPFTPDEVRAIIKHAETSEEWRGCTILGAHTALRLRDVVSLDKANLQGQKLVIRPRKTQRSRKTLEIPLSDDVIAWIEAQEGPWFPTLSKLPASTLSTQFKRLMQKAGVPDKVIVGGVEKIRSYHSLRHSFTSWLAEEDIAPEIRQKLTGHTSAGIHAAYTHHDTGLNKAIKKLPGLSGSNP